MNRRDFFKLIGLGTVATASVPLLGMVQQPAVIKPPSELDDLYAYLESKTVQHPIKGVIPYKLLPYQKEILKTIHENDRVIIVKARQIGMTTMLAGYYAWRSQKDNPKITLSTDRRVTKTDFLKRVKYFNPKISKPYKFHHTDVNSVNIYDEYQFSSDFGSDHSFHFDLYFTHLLSPGKHIFAGSVDKEGKLRNIVYELTGRENPYKVHFYPVSRCQGSWDDERIDRVRPHYTIEEWQRDFDCQWCPQWCLV